MKRILILSTGLLAVYALIVAGVRGQNRPHPAASPFRVVDVSIPEMREAMEKGRLTSRELVSQYLIRLALYENRLHAALAVNPHALEEADQLDRDRAQGKLR